jgi:hypothetical protein
MCRFTVWERFTTVHLVEAFHLSVHSLGDTISALPRGLEMQHLSQPSSQDHAFYRTQAINLSMIMTKVVHKGQ